MERRRIPLDKLDSDPLLEFRKWHDLAANMGDPDPDAMMLATATRDGIPSVRTVLYKGIKDGGVAFYTNYESAKGKQLAENPRASVAFYWPGIYRQVRFEGLAHKMSPEESASYFRSRPRESQIGAWASLQSSTVPSLKFLDERFEEIERKFEGKEIPCPPHWGGFILDPTHVEFWLGQTKRMHHRFLYEKKGDRWVQSLLSP